MPSATDDLGPSTVDLDRSTNEEKTILQRPVRVFVIDDHTVVRRGLRAYLEMVDDMEVIGEAADGQEAPEGLRHWPRPVGRPMWR